ncbi:hypothetical protein ATANTOWER_020481 [Ataeniobius toweri]|uniref:Uncharacterized protein n=1 Tax=Ataeniobius toweri TaxID=208326 RepID=A0ABU7BK42_9TELE|nr:hypothetical protein [Ataeniobius toweri]
MCDAVISVISSPSGRKKAASLDVNSDSLSSGTSLASAFLQKLRKKNERQVVLINLLCNRRVLQQQIILHFVVALDWRVLECQIIVNSGSKLEKFVQLASKMDIRFVQAASPLGARQRDREHGGAEKVFLSVAA